MRWYEGDIAQAVTTSKSRNAIFVVYVEGKDEKSTNLTSHINHTDVSTKLESDNFVALKVEAGSVPHTQFAAIYSNVQVPSIFFIGKSGQPIDIITESSSSSDLCARINSVIQTHTGVPVPAATASNAASTLSESLIQSEKQPEQAVKPEKDDDAVCENGVCAKPSEKSEESPPTDSNAAFLEQEKQELSKEDKMERAKQLVDEKREAKRQQDEEDEKKKELERRRLGQDVQKMQRSQQDQELKNLLEERQRAKNEEKAARDRILAQIAQDKADRATRFASPGAAAAVASSPPPAERAAASNSHIARLQFRLPDGTNRTQEFQASAVLSEVRDFISGNLRLPFRSFSLSTTFPRREFSAADGVSSLRDLQLCPNAVIMVLPAHTGATVSSSDGGGGGGFLSILWLLVSPIVNIFDYFRALIFGQPDNSRTSAPAAPQQDERADPDTEPQQSPAAKRKTMEATVVRRQGNSNIHRLSDRTESDDDNNTWNGNSTQQM